MVMVEPLLFVIVARRSLGFGVVKALRDTDGQIGSVGALGVAVGTPVCVGVRVGLLVGVAVGGLFVGVRVLVIVGVGVIVLDGVALGSTTSVNVGGSVGDGVRVMVGVGAIVGVAVIALSICCCASSSETGTISPGAQYSPVSVQAISRSSPASGAGSDGPPTESVPFAPPS